MAFGQGQGDQPRAGTAGDDAGDGGDDQAAHAADHRRRPSHLRGGEADQGGHQAVRRQVQQREFDLRGAGQSLLPLFPHGRLY